MMYDDNHACPPTPENPGGTYTPPPDVRAALLAAYTAKTEGDPPGATYAKIIDALEEAFDPDAEPIGTDLRWWAEVLEDAADRLENVTEPDEE